MGDAWCDCDLLFASETGGPLTPPNALRNLYTIITHATHLLMDRWDVARVARRLGHANPAITLKLYAHAITDMQGDDIVTPAAFAFAGMA